MQVGRWRKLSAKELTLLNCGIGTLESPLDCKEIQPVHPKGDQPWVFIGRTDAEAETPILWPPDAKSWLIWKTLMLGKIEAGRKREWQDEMVGWHHRLNGHEFENSGSWWWAGKPGVLQSMGSQRVGHDWVTELNWTDGKESAYSAGDLGSKHLVRLIKEK